MSGVEELSHQRDFGQPLTGRPQEFLEVVKLLVKGAFVSQNSKSYHHLKAVISIYSKCCYIYTHVLFM